jgi:hypothetical protein
VSGDVDKEWKRREWVGNLTKGWKKGGLTVDTFKTLTSNAMPLSDEVLDERLKSVALDKNPEFEQLLEKKEVITQRRMSIDSAEKSHDHSSPVRSNSIRRMSNDDLKNLLQRSKSGASSAIRETEKEHNPMGESQ